MKTQKLNPEVLAVATSLLKRANPDLTTFSLAEALKNIRHAPKLPRKMLTLREFCNLTNLSIPTVYRMMKRGEIKTVVIGQRNRRIPADVAEHFLNGEE